ncbi:hypothetical protein DRP05_10710 [Archaeoglobales archaeon]|nr:MAG: hypothetical protein DRP05_10710 [Archaeoglobales archaeon]
MTDKKQFLIYDDNGRSTRFIIGTKEIAAPAFIPEIKNSEDLEVLLRFENALDVNNPIMVPTNLWKSFVENPKFKKRSFDRISLPELVWGHPILFYEPPELFRYKMPEVFLLYSVGGNSSKKKEIIKHLKAGNVEAALNVIHPVYRGFMRRQIYELCESKKIPIPSTIQKSRVANP